MFQSRRLIWTTLLVTALCADVQARPLDSHTPTDAYPSWRLGVQAYSFNRFTFYEAVEKVASLGLTWMEAYPGQRLSKDQPDARLHHTMSADLRAQVKQKLAQHNIRLVAYGVVGLPNDEAECRRVFDFARDMGIQYIASEPPVEALDLIDRLAQEYRICVAFHNHPKRKDDPGYIYWSPDKVAQLCAGRSPWLGACADTGHWIRSGIRPLNALKKLRGRVMYFHLKDLNRFGANQQDQHDVPWGKGALGLEYVLAYLHSIGWTGYISSEYEYHWDNSVPEIRQCVNNFNAVAGTLCVSPWQDLLAPDLSNCEFKPGAWTYQDGVLTRRGGGDIFTKDTYGDFILSLDFKVGDQANSGVFIRTGDPQNFINSCFEVQIHDTTDGNVHGSCGSIYGHLSPSRDLGKMAGRWNHMTIKVMGPLVYITVNGELVIEANLNDWTDGRKNPDGTVPPPWFTIAYKDLPRIGHIGFQDHGNPVQFRNLKIKNFGK